MKEQLTNYSYSDVYLADIFSEMNKVSWSLQGKQLTVFVAKDKLWAFEQKLNYGRPVSATLSLTASQCLDFSDETGGNINTCDDFFFFFGLA